MNENSRLNMSRLDDVEIESIFKGFKAHRLHEVYDNNSLCDMHEFLVHIFKSEPWKNAANFDQRNTFIQSIRSLNADSDDHRRVFLAMSEASNSHAVISYLHMLGHKERVFLKDYSALLTTDQLTMIVKDAGSRIGAVIHYLCRASAVSNGDSLPKLWREMNKAFDVHEKFKERFQEGMQTLVKRFGLKSLGIGDNDYDHKIWIEKFLYGNEASIKDVASAVIAGQLAGKKISRQDVIDECFDFQSKMRLVNDFGFNIDEFGGSKVIRSHNVKPPTYRLDQGLTLR